MCGRTPRVKAPSYCVGAGRMTSDERAQTIISHSDILCETSGALIVSSQELIEKADRLVLEAEALWLITWPRHP